MLLLKLRVIGWDLILCDLTVFSGLGPSSVSQCCASATDSFSSSLHPLASHRRTETVLLMELTVPTPIVSEYTLYNVDRCAMSVPPRHHVFSCIFPKPFHTVYAS